MKILSDETNRVFLIFAGLNFLSSIVNNVIDKPLVSCYNILAMISCLAFMVVNIIINKDEKEDDKND